jgi:hypothetical protein
MWIMCTRILSDLALLVTCIFQCFPIFGDLQSKFCFQGSVFRVGHIWKNMCNIFAFFFLNFCSIFYLTVNIYLQC